MENFWNDMAQIALSPGGLLVLGFFAVAAILALIARLRGKERKEPFALWELISALASWLK